MLCVGGKTRRAVRACLDFLAPPFASRQKVEKQPLKEYKKRRTTLTATLRQAQHDKTVETSAVAIRFMNINKSMAF
jgi:hypothetical protein